MDNSSKCVIVDDYELDRIMVRHLLHEHKDIEIIGEYSSAEQLLLNIDKVRPDILFLDIDMGEISGLQLRNQLSDIPICIFITGHPEYAVESFELNALDFIVKPIHKDRFDKTITRIREYLQLRHKAYLLDKEMGTDAIFIKDGNDKIKIHTHEILYLEAYKDYTKIVTEKAYNIVLSTLGNLLQESPFHNFVRIHRSYAIPKHKVSKVSSNEVYIGSISLPIGRSYKELLSW